MTDDVVAVAKNAILNMALGDVKGAAKDAKLGAFILAACIIDYTSCLYAGRDAAGRGYKDFIAEFFVDQRYSPDDLWNSIRNGLVHNYTVKGSKYTYVDNKPHLHFTTDRYGRTILNMEDFIFAVEKSAVNYFERVEQDPDVKQRLIDRVNDVGIMGVYEL